MVHAMVPPRDLPRLVTQDKESSDGARASGPSGARSAERGSRQDRARASAVLNVMRTRGQSARLGGARQHPSPASASAHGFLHDYDMCVLLERCVQGESSLCQRRCL